MNKHSLYLIGGALLTSTALSTGANATGALKTTTSDVGSLPTAYVTKGVATQVFSATTTTANLVTIGAGLLTASNEIFVDFAPLVVNFDLKIDISQATAAFSTATTPTLVYYLQSTSGTISSNTATVTGCTVQASSDRISILGCNPTAVTAGAKVDAIGIRGVQYTSGAALRTAGTSITLSGATYQASTTSVFETIAPAVVVTSKSAVGNIVVTAGSTAVIDNNATPTVFATLVAGTGVTTTTAVLGSVTFSASAAVGTDLSNTFVGLTSLVSFAEVKIAHSVLTDTALTKITYGAFTKTASDFVSGTVSFTVPAASLLTDPIIVTFNGTSAIADTTGTPTITVTPTAGGTALAAIPAFTGALARLSRGGLSVEVNTVLASAMKASYISFVRIVNQSTTASTATITVRNDSTGLLVGSFATASIPAGGVGEINSVTIDAGLTAAGATPLTNASYKVTVSGSFNGYVQSLLYNVDSKVFSDASGFRNGNLATDP